MRLQPPAGFSAGRNAGRLWVARNDLAEALRPLMARPFDALAGLPGTRALPGGRAGPLLVPSSRRDAAFVVRPYARGGWLGALLWPNRAFLSPRRAARALAAAARARELGLPVAEEAGYTASRAPSGWHLEAWSLALPSVEPLPASLRAHGLAPLSAAAGALRTCFDGGLRHADLNARNILTRREDGAWRAWIVDLDGARLGPPLDAESRLTGLRRLYRSLAKEGALPAPVTDEAFAAAVRDALGAPPDAAALAAFLATCRRDVARHRLLWRARP